MLKADYDISGFTNATEGNVPFLEIYDSGFFKVFKIALRGRWYAAKTISSKIDPQLGRLMLEKEFDILASVSHPNIVKAIDIRNIPGIGIALILEWIEGENLATLLSNNRINKKNRNYISKELLNTLTYLHSCGITHRDIKPSNIIISLSGQPYLIDFGLADDDSYTLFKSVKGTPGYRAPEVESGEKDIDWQRADLYSLGMVFYNLKVTRFYNFLRKKLLHDDAKKRPKDAIAAEKYLKKSKLTFGLIACIIMIFAITNSLCYIKREHANQADVSQSLEVIEDSQKVAISPKDTMFTQKLTINSNNFEVDSKETVKEQSYNYTTKDSTKIHNTAIDVNFAILRASDLRDKLVYNGHLEGREVTRKEIDYITDSILQRGIQFGLCEEDIAKYRRVVHSEDFYTHGSISKLIK